VKDEQGAPASAGTNWRRFGLVLVVPAVVSGVLIAGVANGAVGAHFSVSGQSFKISAEKLVGTGFVQYGNVVVEKNGTKHFVATSGIAEARLYKLCQSVKVPNLPVSLVIHAGEAEGKPAVARDLLIDMTDLRGDATFKEINIGQDASTLKGGGRDATGEAGAFGQQADDVTITDLEQVSWGTSAAEFELTGLDLKVDVASDGKPEECF
jgi:hypothetical protein